MRRSILTSLAVGSILAAQPCHAAEPLEVTSLDLGGCWVHQEPFPEPLWKLASFSDQAAITLSAGTLQQTLSPLISAELQTVFESFQGSATETFFHCSAGGHIFLTSVHEGTVPLCVWSKMQRNDTGSLTLNLIGVFPDYVFQPNRPCSGVSRKSLLVDINPGSDIQAVMAYLRTSERYKGVISSLFSIGQTIIVLRLTDAYDFRENVVKALIESDDVLANDLQAVEYNGLVYIVGEEQRLFAGDYPGF
jgi:hypothetical protein